ncbi:CAP domain-containing protein [Clostridium gasigenes]|uniref:CAP domain-containing protein n=1 Tax=Clostridium gasigenes TaxID=94869 RepID=A0A7X0VPC7_9CLOT|nr:CAP domain-containing protein [Clostridium gasigenes]MBB6713114.1 CAP domain-containing protein [Clostridium gasigenes]
MIKIKLLISMCVDASLGFGILHGVSKPETVNKTEIAQIRNEEKSPDSAVMSKEELVVKEKEKINVDNIATNNVVKEAVVTEATPNIEVEQSKDPEWNTVENKQTESCVNNEKNIEEVVARVEGKVPAKVPAKVQEVNSSQSDNYVAEIEQAIFARVNKERSANGLGALSYNNTMQNYGRIKSKDMGDRGYFDHANPEGELIIARMKKDGVNYNSWGENIAYIQGGSNNASLADQFMTNWMNSPGHRANILLGNFASIGVGVYKVGNTYYATQEFYR